MEQPTGETSKVKKLRKVGLTCVVLSFVFYGAILLVPFLPYPTSTKVAISTALAVIGEASFWIGGFILGKEFIAKYRRYFNPLLWFKKATNELPKTSNNSLAKKE
jgi:hypothetical protein